MLTFTAELARTCRQQFPALNRLHDGKPLIFFDGPAGTQVPQRVADAVRHYLLFNNSNRGGYFPVSQDSDRELERALQTFATFVGSKDPAEIIFGQNMTSLTFSFARSLAQTWNAGDEIIVTATDHDANITPWAEAAASRGASVQLIPLRPVDCSLDMDRLKHAIGPRTRLIAATCACNASGGLNPIDQIVALARQVGANVFLDAVHYAPHLLIDVARWGCDFVAFSTYKFFGPHLGVLWAKREHLERLPPTKVRPSKNILPWKWMTGTQSHEGIMGGCEAIEYLADIGRQVLKQPATPLRPALAAAFEAISEYETHLAWQLIEGLLSVSGTKIFGITDRSRARHRVATVAFIHQEVATPKLAQALSRRGVCLWSGNYYALEFTRQLGLEPDGMIRLGLVHYNTAEEVNRFLEIYRQVLQEDFCIGA